MRFSPYILVAITFCNLAQACSIQINNDVPFSSILLSRQDLGSVVNVPGGAKSPFDAHISSSEKTSLTLQTPYELYVYKIQPSLDVTKTIFERIYKVVVLACPTQEVPVINYSQLRDNKALPSSFNIRKY